jgi:mitochondrial fission protein ELM1
MAARPLTIWAVSDGRAGTENQVLGLAEAVARLTPAEIVVKRIAWKAPLARAPTWLNLLPRWSLASGSDRIAPPWPDLWIGAGRASLPLSIRMRRWSRGSTYVAQTQAPRMPLRRFDLVIPPRHDRLSGPNVLAITGSPHRTTPERLASEAGAFAAGLGALRGPKVAVLKPWPWPSTRLWSRRAARC